MVRHGETELNASDAFRSWKDVPLDQHGVEQAHEAAEFLSQFPVAAIVTSPLSRAQATAHIIGQRLGVNPEPDSALLPWNLGVLSGQPKEPLRPVRDYYIDHPNEKVPQGESIHDFEARFEPALKAALSQGNGLILFVSHTSNVVAANNILTEAGERPEESETVQPGGVVGIFQSGGGYELKPLFRSNEEAVQGTPLAGYIENGKQFCGECIHKAAPGVPFCKHPQVLKDPRMQDRIVNVEGRQFAHINLENGCCDYVNKGTDTEQPDTNIS